MAQRNVKRKTIYQKLHPCNDHLSAAITSNRECQFVKQTEFLQLLLMFKLQTQPFYALDTLHLNILIAFASSVKLHKMKITDTKDSGRERNN